MSTRWHLQPVLAGIALVVAACGGGASSSPAPSGAVSAPPSVPATAAPSTAPGTPIASPVGGLPAALPPSPIAIVASPAAGGDLQLLVADPSGTRTPVPVTGIVGSEISARPGSREVALPVTLCEVADEPCGTILVAVDLATGAERRLTPYRSGANDTMPAWSPDGTRLAFAASRKGDPFGQELYVMPATGGDATLLETGLPTSQSPAWSPDGGTVAFIGSDPTSVAGLYLIDADGGPARRLIDLDGSGWLSWSPDGTRIAHRVTNMVETGPGEMTGYAAVAIFNVEDGGSTLIRATPSMNTAPTWSPDGASIAFIAEEAGLPGRLALMDPDGANPRLLGSADWADRGLAWLP